MKYLSLIILILFIFLCTNNSIDTEKINLEVFAGNDTTVIKKDTISLSGRYVSTATVLTFNWYLLNGTTEFILNSSLQTQYTAPDSVCTLSFIFEAQVSNVIDRDTINISVVSDTTLIVNAGVDQTVLKKLPVVLHGTYITDSAVGTYWKIGTNNFAPASPETTIIAPDTTLLLPCIFRVINSDNKESEDTVFINVISLDSLTIVVNAGADTSIIVGSQLKLNGTYTGTSLAQKFWKIGNNDFILASLDTTITLPDTPTVFKCILKVKNDYSEDLDTVNINVFKLILKAVGPRDTIVFANTQVKLHGTYVGQNIVNFFWKIGSNPFTPGRPDTIITVPDSTTYLSCIFKIQDINSNEAVDTSTITVIDSTTKFDTIIVSIDTIITVTDTTIIYDTIIVIDTLPDTSSVYASTGNDTTVFVNTLLKLKGSYLGNVIKTFWKIGGSDFIPASLETTITVPATPMMLPCIFKVLGTLSKADQDTINAHVILFDTTKDTTTMVLIPAKNNTFIMGNINDVQANPIHNVTFTYNFYMSRTEITQEEFVSLLNMNPSPVKNGDYPVYNCNWFDVIYYCNEKSKSENLDTVYSYTEIGGTIGYQCFMRNVKIDYTKKGYRLPTESEWEFACKAGAVTNFYWGDPVDEKYLWYINNSPSNPQIVGKKLPNSFGLYDMSGNVREWCNDLYSPYTAIDQIDPKGPSEDNTNLYRRVVRGGAYSEIADSSTSYNRKFLNPHKTSSKTGFRIVREE